MNLRIGNTMMEGLSQRDIRALKIGAVCLAAVLVFVFATKWLGHWHRVRQSLAAARAELKVINPSAAKQKGLLSKVPVFEMPRSEEQQKFLFRNKFNEQLKKAGIKSKPLQTLATGRSAADGYKLLRLKCSGKVKFGQVLDLLASLNKNPYLVGIEQMQIRCGPKKPSEKRQEVELDLTVSTFVESSKMQSNVLGPLK